MQDLPHISLFALLALGASARRPYKHDSKFCKEFLSPEKSATLSPLFSSSSLMNRSCRPVFLFSLLFLVSCTSSAITTKEEKVAGTTNPFARTNAEFDLSRSTLSFVGKSNIINHQGRFKTFEATLTLDPETPYNLEKAHLKAVIDILSVETDAPGLTGHLQKKDFFDAETYPEATFLSTVMRSLGGSAFAVTGNLTIKGVTRSITLDVLITNDVLELHYDLPRQSFGIGNDSYGDKLLEPIVPVDALLVFTRNKDL